MSAAFAGVSKLLLIIIMIGVIFAVKIGLGIIVGTIARKKGHSFGGFFVLGMFFFIIGLIVSLCLSDEKAQAENEELLRLKKLLDENIITQEEFETKKKQILGL